MNNITSSWTQPLRFINATKDEVIHELQTKGFRIWSIHDQVSIALQELFEVKNPSQKDNINQSELKNFINNKGVDYGVWVYFQWSGELVRFPTSEDYLLLRTTRNRNLITAEEQQTLRKATVLVAGMSVGSNVAETIAYQATAGELILADMDHLEPTNLNRIRAKYSDVGTSKIDVVAKKVSELDPFMRQIHLKNGITSGLLDTDLKSKKIDVIVDEVDDLSIKVKLRKFAIENKIPVVMATDDGEDILIDVERYDIDENPQILHGLIPNDVMLRLGRGESIPRSELGILIGKHFVGFDNVPLRMLESLSEVGKTIPAWPQLGTAATLAGVVATYCVKQILIGVDLPSGRAVIGPNQTLNPEINTDKYQKRKQRLLKDMMNQSKLNQ